MTESKSVALPLGYTPMSGTAKSRRKTPPKPRAAARRLCPARIRRNKVGWMEGIEPSCAGATIRCVNRFATSTMHKTYGIKSADACQAHFSQSADRFSAGEGLPPARAAKQRSGIRKLYITQNAGFSFIFLIIFFYDLFPRSVPAPKGDIKKRRSKADFAPTWRRHPDLNWG